MIVYSLFVINCEVTLELYFSRFYVVVIVLSKATLSPVIEVDANVFGEAKIALLHDVVTA